MSKIVLLLIAALVCVAAHAGMGFPAPGKYSGMPQNSIDVEDVFRKSGPNSVSNLRGVIIQGIARFNDQKGKSVSRDKVFIQQMNASPSGYCIRIAEASCRALPLEKADLIALASFVRSGRAAAYTSPDSADQSDEIRAVVSKNGMVRITRELGSWISIDDYVAKELQTKYFVRTLSYIDFDNDFVAPDRELKRAESIAQQLNTDMRHKAAPDDPVDGSYVNADFHAYFAVAPAKEPADLVCEGLPGRYHWMIGPDDEFSYVGNFEFASDPKSSAEQTAALELFCTAAILRGVNRSELDKIK